MSDRKLPVYRGKGWFFPGSREFLADPLHFTVREAERTGDFYRVPFFGRQLYISTNLEVIRHVLQVNHRNYSKSPAYHQLRLALGNGLVTSEGDFWRRQRRMAQPGFYKAALTGLFDTMARLGESYCEKLSERLAAGETTFDFSPEMMKLTADIVLRTLFSTASLEGQQRIYGLIMEAQEYVMYRTTHPYLIPFTYINGRHRHFLRGKASFDSLINSMIAERRRLDAPPADLLQMLLMARDEETGEGMSETQLRDEAITLFAAGHETSANALAWTFHLLATHPGHLARLQAEVDEALNGRTPTLDDLSRLPYTRQVIDEAMRLYPPAYAVGRQADAPDEILGYRIPRKAIFFLSIYALHRDPRYWDRPDEFDPDRFAPGAAPDRPRLAYMPFGAGPRMCIGNHFALMEMQLLLALLVQRFHFRPVPGRKAEMNPLVTLRPKNGVWVEVKRR